MSDFRAYYYSFEGTGCAAVDSILEAVANAGRSYHHTDEWSSSRAGPSEADKIQKAAIEAAAKIESDAKVIAALIATLAPFAASAYDRDWLPPDWEIGTPLRYLRDARAAIAATSEQTAGD